MQVASHKRMHLTKAARERARTFDAIAALAGDTQAFDGQLGEIE
jgi:hypothetical protein